MVRLLLCILRRLLVITLADKEAFLVKFLPGTVPPVEFAQEVAHDNGQRLGARQVLPLFLLMVLVSVERPSAHQLQGDLG